MKRFAWKLLVLVLIAVGVFFWIIKASIISSYLTKKMRVPISIEWISIWPREMQMHNFKIRNPKGFKTPIAFTAETTEIDYAWKKLMGNPTEIDQIVMDTVFLGVEFSNPLGSKNNWTAIGQNMPAAKGGQRVIIRKLILHHLNVEIRGLGLMGKTTYKQVDHLEFDNIDSSQGFPTEELVRKIFGGSGLQEYLKDAFSPQNQLQRLTNPFQIFGGSLKTKGPGFPEPLFERAKK